MKHLYLLTAGSRVTAVTWTKFNGLSFSFQEYQHFFHFLLQLDLKWVS